MTNIGGSFEVVRDGLTYCIEFTSSVTLHKVEALLVEDQSGWHLSDVTRGHNEKTLFSKRIGRRRTWQAALHDALVIVENASKNHEE